MPPGACHHDKAIRTDIALLGIITKSWAGAIRPERIDATVVRLRVDLHHRVELDVVDMDVGAAETVVADDHGGIDLRFAVPPAQAIDRAGLRPRSR